MIVIWNLSMLFLPHTRTKSYREEATPLESGDFEMAHPGLGP